MDSQMLELGEFYSMPPNTRDRILRDATQESHAWHYARNRAYRSTLSARGIGPCVGPDEFAHLLRVSAITFKAYVEQLGTPFPQDEPRRTVEWLADQVSLDLPTDRAALLRARYRSLERLFTAIEDLYSDLGIEVVTSSGTSGVFTIMVRDSTTMEIATQAYYAAIGHAWTITPQHDLIFVMPDQTRVAMARIASMGTRVLDWGAESGVVYTMPFAADPDSIRIRTGRTFRPGLRGLLEKHAMHRFMRWAYAALAEARFVTRTIEALKKSVDRGGPAMLLGGLVQLDAVGQRLLAEGGMELPRGSRVATGGGPKEAYHRTPDQIRADLGRALRSADGGRVPVADVYGMAEGHWAAFQCPEGNYHMPPWVRVAAVDDDDRLLEGSDVTGLLAFWDPLGGGRVYPPFFRTADRVRLVNGSGHHDPGLICPCGDDTPYLVRDSILRVDLIEEAGCAATL